jgi:hypothetical protein
MRIPSSNSKLFISGVPTLTTIILLTCSTSIKTYQKHPCTSSK